MQSVNNRYMKKVIEIIWQYKLLLGTKFLESLGTLLLLLELSSLLFNISSDSNSLRICIFIVIIVLSLVYALYSLFCPKKELTICVNKKTSLTIKQGDVMKANGMRVIPVNEYFDTHLGDGIIKDTSIHGQFLAQFNKKQISEVRKAIDEQLGPLTQLPSDRVRTMVNGLPQKRYPLGTCIRIVINKQYYLLVAVTRFNSNEHVETSAEEYPEVIRKLFNGIEQLHDGNAVYMPLVGSGLAGYDLTNMQMLNTIVQAAHNANRLSLTNGLHLYLYDDKQINSINLNVIKYLFDRWVTLK